MQVHAPFHPFQSHPLTAPAVEIWNLVLILLGVVLVLAFSSF
jgi:hypothetical protein